MLRHAAPRAHRLAGARAWWAVLHVWIRHPVLEEPTFSNLCYASLVTNLLQKSKACVLDQVSVLNCLQTRTHTQSHKPRKPTKLL